MIIFTKIKTYQRSRGAIRKSLTLIVALIYVQLSFAQINISGKIVDQEGGPFVGVNVVQKGTTNGTVSNIDGNYSISVNEGSILVFSFIGYLTEEVVVTAGSSTIDITLMPDLVGLDEVVVIGYGSIKKADVTSSIASVKSDDFVQGSVKDASQLIQGKVAGLTISNYSGDPTEGPTIMLRGHSSLEGTSDPLVLVDGIPGTLSSVAPEDIESIDVLKDGSAASIYGTRGTNGVIIITTKSSSFDEALSIDYSGYVSVSTIKDRLDFMDADELREKWDQGYTFEGANLEDFGANTDWLDEITRNAVSHVHNLSFRGGNESTKMSATLNYKNNQGIFIKTDNEKYTGRLDLTHSMFNHKLTTNINTILSEQIYWAGEEWSEGVDDESNPDEDAASFNSYVYRQALIRNPTEPIKNEDGTWYERDVYFYDNPVAYLKESDGENRFRNIRLTASMSFKPFDGLELKGLYSRKGNYYTGSYYETMNHVSTIKYGSDGFAEKANKDYFGNYSEITANFRKALGAHSFSVLAGYNYEDNVTEYFYANNKYFSTDATTSDDLGQGSGLEQGEAKMGSGKRSDKLVAVFSRVSYSFNDKYLLMASLRHEGSSKFGDNYKWGNFPGVSVGWRMDKEDFMSNLAWLSNLKLRTGYGITGINAASSYTSIFGLKYDDYLYYNGAWIRSLVPSRNANEDLRWEKKIEINAGFDFGLFNGRLNGAFDLYKRNTTDLLWNYSVSTPPYQYKEILANVGEIENKGLEVLLNGTPVKTKDFVWNISSTYSTNSNKLVSISNEEFQLTTDYIEEGYTGEPIQIATHRLKIGSPIGDFYGLKSVDITNDGIWIIEKPDGTRVEATESTTDDRQVLGNGIPKHYLSFNTNFKYKNIDLSINMRGAFGFQILNFSRMFYENPTISYNVLNSAFDRVYGKAVLSDVQRLVSYYVEDGDYWKIDNVTLGYSVPVQNNKYIKRFRVYTSALNLLTISGYKGIDPEVQQTGLYPGDDERDKFPTTRTFTFGVNLTF